MASPLLLLRAAAAAAEQGSAEALAQSIADYPTGDSCLFCHRDDIGSSWLDNAHAWTIRPVGEAPRVSPVPPDATHVIGKEHFRPLKQNGYGKFALLTVGGTSWQPNVFEKQCAGCHTTAVNPQTGEFSSIGLDCYACHGNVPEDHATRKGAALLSRTRPNADKEVIEICGSCHLRGGRSKISGRPYPHAYIAGNDLFKDFQVDLQLDSESAARQQRLTRLPEDARGLARRLGQELRRLSSRPRSARAAATRQQALQRDLSLLVDAHSDRHRLREIARLIDVAILRERDVIREQLQRNVQQQRDPAPARTSALRSTPSTAIGNASPGCVTT